MINYNDIVKKLKEIFKKAGLGEATFDICAKNGRPKLTYFFIGDELLKVKEQIEKEFLINLENYYLKKATLGSLARHLYRVMMSNEKMEEPPPRKKIVKTLVSIFKIILEVRGNEIDTGKKLRDYAIAHNLDYGDFLKKVRGDINDRLMIRMVGYPQAGSTIEKITDYIERHYQDLRAEYEDRRTQT